MRFALCLTGTQTIGHDPRNRRSRSRNHQITLRQGIGHDQRNDRSRSSGIPIKDENQQLKRDLARKEKALSQAAALLILQKKFRALWEDEAK